MRREVAGIHLSDLRSPIYEALRQYEELSHDRLSFEKQEASRLEPTPEATTSARSTTDLKYLGGKIGEFVIIAFKPGDGTGREVDFGLEELEVAESYPTDPRVVPRKKGGVYSELHMTILSQKIDDAHAHPKLFAGSLDLLGLDGSTVKKIGGLGYHSLEAPRRPLPQRTLTVGHRLLDNRDGERFGDPHAVYNSQPDSLQVCGFLAVSHAVHKEFPFFVARQNPQEPLDLAA